MRVLRPARVEESRPLEPYTLEAERAVRRFERSGWKVFPVDMRGRSCPPYWQVTRMPKVPLSLADSELPDTLMCCSESLKIARWAYVAEVWVPGRPTVKHAAVWVFDRFGFYGASMLHVVRIPYTVGWYRTEWPKQVKVQEPEEARRILRNTGATNRALKRRAISALKRWAEHVVNKPTRTLKEATLVPVSLNLGYHAFDAETKTVYSFQTFDQPLPYAFTAMTYCAWVDGK